MKTRDNCPSKTFLSKTFEIYPPDHFQSLDYHPVTLPQLDLFGIRVLSQEHFLQQDQHGLLYVPRLAIFSNLEVAPQVVLERIPCSSK